MGTNQERCPDGTCSNKTLRESGCFICSKQHGDDDEKCETCLEDHIVYDGRCVGCLSMEVCPFNNSDVVYCIDEHDLSHCVDEPDATKIVGMVLLKDQRNVRLEGWDAEDVCA